MHEVLQCYFFLRCIGTRKKDYILLFSLFSKNSEMLSVRCSVSVDAIDVRMANIRLAEVEYRSTCIASLRVTSCSDGCRILFSLSLLLSQELPMTRRYCKIY